MYLAPILWGLLASKGFCAEPLQDALAQLQSSDVIKRRIGAQELINLRNPAAAPALTKALSDKDAYVRTLAVRALGYMRWTAAGPKLQEMSATDANLEVRQSALLSLRFLNDPAGVPALVKAVKDPSEPVKLQAISALTGFRTTEATAALIDASKDASVKVRRTAVSALGQVGDPASLEALKAALKDADAYVRANAAQGLATVGDKSVIPNLETALKDPETVVKVSAARSLALRKNRSGFDVALGAANRPDPITQLMAIETLGWIRDPQAVPMLTSLTQNKNPNVKAAAQQALRDIQTKSK